MKKTGAKISPSKDSLSVRGEYAGERVEKIRGFSLLTRILSAFYKIDDRKEVVKYGTPGRPVIREEGSTFGANYFAGDLCPEDIF